MVNVKKLVGKESQVVAVLCMQYGDSGKGKFSDLLMRSWGDVCARGTGGANAGHTVFVGGRKRIFHLIPAGITYDNEGKITILGQGMVIDPLEFQKEIREIQSAGGSHDGLYVSEEAHVVMPYHIEMDRSNKSQANGGIGSTGRGIGPAYADKIARDGITIRDLLKRDTLIRRLETLRSKFPERGINIERIVSELDDSIRFIRSFADDTGTRMHNLLAEGKKVVLEGAQGALLSVEHGTYPYVTSSDCTLNGTASGVGISANKVDCVLGICKFPIMSRVGAGPFPTEFGGRYSELYCGQTHAVNGKEESVWTREAERKIFPDPDSLINSSSEFLQGIGARMLADEYGATTGRPRRVGWTDAVSARYTARVSGVDKLVLTKVDSVPNFKEFRICIGYSDGTQTSERFPRSSDELRGVSPIYSTYKGFGDLGSVNCLNKAPDSLRNAIIDFEKFVGPRVGAVSVGPEADQTWIN
jgi:adenylosuccinate synthase